MHQRYTWDIVSHLETYKSKQLVKILKPLSVSEWVSQILEYRAAASQLKINQPNQTNWINLIARVQRWKVQRFKGAECKGAKLTAKKNKVTNKQTDKQSDIVTSWAACRS